MQTSIVIILVGLLSILPAMFFVSMLINVAMVILTAVMSVRHPDEGPYVKKYVFLFTSMFIQILLMYLNKCIFDYIGKEM